MASSGEGKPLALTEAMLCGRPAVVTDVGGNAELVSDRVTGFVTQSALAPARPEHRRALRQFLGGDGRSRARLDYPSS
jgi:glycosyltransferase involved in cell wall biosynthesis